MAQIASELCQLAQKQDRVLRMSSLEVMKIVILLLNTKFPKEIQKDVVDVAAPYIKDDDFFLAQLSLEVLAKIFEINPTSSATYKTAIENCVKLTKSSLVQGNTTNRLSEVFNLVGLYKLSDSSALFNSLMSDLNKNCLFNVSKALAGLVLGVDENSRKGFIQQLLGKVIFAIFCSILMKPLKHKKVSNSSTEAITKQVSLLTIAEIGKKIKFDDNKGLLNLIITLFQTKEEDTKYYAAVALGGIAVVSL